MQMTLRRRLQAAVALLGLLAAMAGHPSPAIAAEPAMYAVDFVSTAAQGAGQGGPATAVINDQGVAAGIRFTIPAGCTPATCAPVPEAVVWSGDAVIPLPGLPGFSSVSVRGINSSNWVAGFAGDASINNSRAVVWKPTGSGYTVIDLGVLPGTTSSSAAGIDDLGRVVGYSTTPGAPFVWTEAGGLVDLAAQGFPNEVPLALSPGGTVATPGFWYRLGDPGSVTAVPAPPTGFTGPGSYAATINDAGDQGRFLLTTCCQFRPHLFRLSRTGVWQQIYFLPASHLAPFGIGSINDDGDITATMNGDGLIAYGPSGLAQPLAGKLSPAYGGNDVTTGGAINNQGEILAQVFVGRSPRLVRLLPTEDCAPDCVRVPSTLMWGRFLAEPGQPGQCTPLARNLVFTRVVVTGPGGFPLPGAAVSGRFLDDYYLDKPVTATTNGNGVAWFGHFGPACVGAIAFLVEDAAKPGNGPLNRTTGQLTNFVIPRP